MTETEAMTFLLSRSISRQGRVAAAALLTLAIAVASAAPVRAQIGFDSNRGVMPVAPAMAPIMPAVVQIITEGKKPQEPERAEPAPGGGRRLLPPPDAGSRRGGEPHQGGGPNSDSAQEPGGGSDTDIISTGSGV